MTTEQLAASGFFASLTPFYDCPTGQQQAAARQALAEVGLADRGDQPFRLLSSGQQSRAWLARALVHHPELLILDEPAADLDLRGRETLLATLDRLARCRGDLTVVLVTHHLEELLPDTSEVLLLRSGRTLAQGSPQEVLTSERLSEAFGCGVQVKREGGRWYARVEPDVWQHLIDGTAQVHSPDPAGHESKRGPATRGAPGVQNVGSRERRRPKKN
jgi:iron complex transport system ATP-binding protein